MGVSRACFCLLPPKSENLDRYIYFAEHLRSHNNYHPQGFVISRIKKDLPVANSLDSHKKTVHGILKKGHLVLFALGDWFCVPHWLLSLRTFGGFCAAPLYYDKDNAGWGKERDYIEDLVVYDPRESLSETDKRPFLYIVETEEKIPVEDKEYYRKFDERYAYKPVGEEDEIFFRRFKRHFNIQKPRPFNAELFAGKNVTVVGEFDGYKEILKEYVASCGGTFHTAINKGTDIIFFERNTITQDQLGRDYYYQTDFDNDIHVAEKELDCFFADDLFFDVDFLAFGRQYVKDHAEKYGNRASYKTLVQGQKLLPTLFSFGVIASSKPKKPGKLAASSANKKTIVRKLLIENEAYFDLMDESLQKDVTFLLSATEKNMFVYFHLSEEVRRNKKLIQGIVKQHGESIVPLLDEETLQDKETFVSIIKQCPRAIRLFGGNVRNDPEILVEAVTKDAKALLYADESFRKDKDFLLAVLRNGSGAGVIKSFDESLANDREVVLEAVRRYGFRAKDCVGKAAFTNDRELALEAVRISGQYLEIVGDAFKKDKEIVMEAVQHGEGHLVSPFMYADESLRNDREVALVAIKAGRCGVLAHASDALKEDKELVLEAIQRDSYAQAYLGEKMRNDRDVILAALKNPPSLGFKDDYPLKTAGEEVRKDKEVILTAVKCNEWCGVHPLQYADPSLRKDREFTIEALKLNKDCAGDIDDSFKNDKSFIEEVLKVDLSLARNVACHSPLGRDPEVRKMLGWPEQPPK